ncbi:extracellular solute-binding protein [Candidatus Gracilibacteria bacterium]|nr:extracellular solute-binding protein [Candidatus Gracilibacteria bacterium]
MTDRLRRLCILVTCLWVILLVGCSGQAITNTPTTAVPPAAARPGGKTTLYLWYAWPYPEQRALVNLIDRYNRASAEVEIIAQARPVASLASDLRVAAEEGRGPHLALLKNHTLGTLVETNLLRPLNDLISPKELERLLPAAVAGGIVEHADQSAQLYGIPISFDTVALYYNRANWLAAPTDTETMVRNARGLSDIESQPSIWGMAYNLALDRSIAYLYAFGGEIVDAEGQLVLGSSGRAGTERWLEWIVDLRQDEQILAGLDSVAIDRALASQQALMTIDWAHALPTYRDLWGDQLGVALLPALGPDEGRPQPYVQSEVVSINALASDAEQRAAIDFIRYLIAEESQRTLLAAGRQPVLLDLELTGSTPDVVHARIFREQAQQGQPMPNSRMHNTVVWRELESMCAGVLRGILTPEQAVTEADTRIRDQLGLAP